ncbi:Fbox domain containing protein [Acanthamoeba castellanii str. Neff]|uniref:Fbox domain containing protein n=1 Tax=Acanthamoeba castellanii (strain ATCC 30010 / Neff) TaxID=1257118 RepID=L8GJ90_ACACF|nr:Fbox domain containing protein [Acanthamoeba castellanii str. Neff]ELR12256.1 Fbox domain containing protein [Acanthamoeba castellanii str. Neff]
MFAPSHFHSHYFDDGCSTDEFIDAEVKVDLQHVEFKGLRLSSLPPPLHHHHLGSDPMSIVDPMLEEDGDQMLEDADLADYAYATGFGGGLVGATNNIEVLPNEVFVLIFSYLDSRELLTVASTCHRWRHLAEEETLWKQEVVRGCRSHSKAHALLKHYTPLLAASSKEADRERATGQSRWKSVWLAQKKTKGNWRKAAFRRRLLPKQHTAAVFCLAFDDEHIVTGSSDHTVQVWDINSGAPLRSLTGHQYAVWNIKLVGSTAISASYDGTLRLWDVKTGRNLNTLRGHASAIWGLDAMGNKVVSSSTDTFIRLWDMETGECERRVAANQDTIWCSQFLDQNTVITGGADIRIWDLRVNTGNEGECTPVSQFSGHKDAIRCLQADSNYVVSGSYDSTAGVWDRIAGKRLWELSGHTDSITTLQYDTSGMLITSSFDQSFRVWDIKDGTQMTMWGKADEEQGKFEVQRVDHNETAESVEDKGGKVYTLRFDDHRLITGREDCRLRIDDFSARSLY